MLFHAAIIYALRIISGFGTLFVLLLIGRFYSSNEIAQFALFIFFFNMAVVISVWGRNVTIVDAFNAQASNETGKLRLNLLAKIVDSLVVSGLLMIILKTFGYWSYGFLAIIPASVSAILSALLVAQAKPFVAIVFNELSKAILPLIVAGTILIGYGKVNFNLLLACSYLSLFMVLPILLVYVKANQLSNFNFKLSVKSWVLDKSKNWPIVFPQILFVIVAQADRFVIEYLGTSQELASYFSAQALYAVMIFAFQSIFVVVTPHVSLVANNGSGNISKEGLIVLSVSSCMSILLIPMAYIYFGLISIDAHLAINILTIFVMGSLTSLLFGIGFQAMQFYHHKLPYFKVSLLGVLIQYLFIFLFYGVFGVYAVALGFFIYTVLTSIAAFIFWRLNGVSVSPFTINRIKRCERV